MRRTIRAAAVCAIAEGRFSVAVSRGWVEVDDSGRVIRASQDACYTLDRPRLGWRGWLGQRETIENQSR